MTTATLTQEKPAQSVIKTSEVSYVSAQELYELIQSGEWDYCEDDYYIRSEISGNSKDYQDALKTFDLETGTELVQIMFPVTLYNSLNQPGKKHLLNGNNRVKNFLFLYENATDKSIFADVPYNTLENAITEEIALLFQTKANDTTIKHSVVDKLNRASQYYDRRVDHWKKTGMTLQNAKGQASLDCRKALGNISQPQYSKISNVANSGALVLGMVENDMIDINTAYDIIAYQKKAVKTDETLTTEVVFNSIKAIAESRNSYNSKGLTRLEPQDLEAYKEALRAAKEAAKAAKKPKVETPEFTTLVELKDASMIGGDAYQAAEEFARSMTDEEQKEFIGKLIESSKGEVITHDNVSKLIEKLTKATSKVTYETFKEQLNFTKDNVLSQKFDEIELSEHTASSESKAVANALKATLKAVKYCQTKEVKGLYRPIMEFTNNILSVVGDEIKENSQDYEALMSILESLNSDISTVDKKLTANLKTKEDKKKMDKTTAKAVEASSKVIELPTEDEEANIEIEEDEVDTATIAANAIKQAMQEDEQELNSETSEAPQISGNLPF